MTPFTHSRSSITELHAKDEVFIGKIPYLVEKTLRGGMGLVFLLEWNGDSESDMFGVHRLRVALKTILPEFLNHESRGMFYRELTVWAGFSHSNIVALNEILDGGNDGWIAAMDGCGGSLKDHLEQRKRLSPNEAALIFCDILGGLAYAYHQHQVLHLDLKPANVLYGLHPGRIDLTEEERGPNPWLFMLSDWGIASIKQEQLKEIVGRAANDRARLETMNNMGTILYMAPERFISGIRSSPSSDIFSLGLIYLEMLTGYLPYSLLVDPIEESLSGTYFTNTQHILKHHFIPKAVQEIILDCIAPNPNDRPSSYKKLYERVVAAQPAIRNACGKGVVNDVREETLGDLIFHLTFLRKESAKTQANNLRAVGREQDAHTVLQEYLGTILDAYTNQMYNPGLITQDNPVLITLFMRESILLDEFEFAKQTIEEVIELAEKRQLMDLTKVYFG